MSTHVPGFQSFFQEMNQVKNLVTGAYGGVPDTARA